MSDHNDGTDEHPSPNRGSRPSLERPSLFAGMVGHGGEHEGDSVRLLPTLESTRRSARVPLSRTVRRDNGGRQRGWPFKAMMGLMGLGCVALLGSFWVVVHDTRPVVAKAPTPPAATVQHTNGPLSALQAMAEPASGAASSNQAAHEAARIEALLADAPAKPDAAASRPATPHPAASALPLRHVVANTPAATEKPASAHPASHSFASAARPAARRDDDVALLEAMFEHTGPRKVPASVSEDWRKHCAGLADAEATACLAKVCGQHPKAPICRSN